MSRRICFAILSLAMLAGDVLAQRGKNYLRDNPRFKSAFREIVAKPAEATVRVLSDGKEVALGVVVAADGWVLTKAHDLSQPIECRLKDGRTFAARWIGHHKDHDLALLRIDAKGLPTVPLADSKGTPVGNWVACAGTGEHPVAFGVVSVATRNVEGKGPASANPRSGYLGIALDPSPEGLRIIQVIPKSAADKAGLKVDDIILTLEGKAVSREPQEFIAKMQKTRPGQLVKLRIKRDELELDIQVKLDKRPFNRGDFQNALGSDLSSRRSGYPVILQFDGVVKPADCGGPLVNLDGQVIGLTISRAGRTETYAIPAEAIKPLLADLKSGKLPPPKEDPRPVQKNEQPKKNAAPKSSSLDKGEQRSLEALLTLMHRRLALMPDVARAKWNAGLPVADPVREKAFLHSIATRAKDLGLDPEQARRFFRSAA